VTKIIRAVGAFVAAYAFAAPAMAQLSEADFYKGKQVQLVIGYASGSGYDFYARLLARHMGNHIPGNPNIIPQNMPGAGSLKAANWLYSVAPKDGTVFATTGRGVPMTPLLGGAGANFDATKITYVGSMNNEVSVAVAWHTSGITTIEDVMKRELVVGATAVGVDDTTVFPAVMNAMIGTKFKWIVGYPGGNAMNLAMERGETQGRAGWSWSSVKSTQMDWYKEKKIHVLVQMSLSKHEDLPDVPLVMDLAKTDEQRQVLELIFSRQVLGRPFYAPPSLPASRVKTLREAFDATMKDKAMLAEADKSQMEITPVSGVEIEQLIARIYKTPADVVKRAIEIMPQPKGAH
jgi:tripartite-type tricarboxylate transporter receptor subunit TctC